MKTPLKVYWKLFRSTFHLSAFTFGGGFVIVPLMKKKFVDELGWMKEDEMLNFAALAQSSPGATSVNVSILVGYRIAGVPGAAVAILGTILPPLILLSMISMFYQWFRENLVIAAVLKAMQAGIAAVIADIAVNMGRNVTREERLFPWIMMIAIFIAVHFFQVNVLYLILASILVGILRTLWREKRGNTL